MESGYGHNGIVDAKITYHSYKYGILLYKSQQSKSQKKEEWIFLVGSDGRLYPETMSDLTHIISLLD